MMKQRSIRFTLTLVVMLTLALGLAVFAASCGGKTASTGTGSSPQVSGSTTGNATIDSYLKQLDQEMNSVDPNADFNDSNLSNQSLGVQ